MSSPVRPSQFCDLVPEPTASVCDKLKTLVQAMPTLLCDYFNWMLDSSGNFSAEFKTMLQNSIVAPGYIMGTVSATVPSGYLLCDGSTVSRTTYSALFDAIGTTYGSGDGINTFTLPDIRGRALIGAGQGSGLTSRSIGDAGIGVESVTLDESNMPSHTHSLLSDAGYPAVFYDKFVQEAGGHDNPTYAFQNGIPETKDVTGAAGSGEPFSIMTPSFVVFWFIKT